MFSLRLPALVLVTLAGLSLLACGSDGGDADGAGGSSGEGGAGSDVEPGSVGPGEPCSRSEECVPGSVCFSEFCVGAGSLRISLSFTGDTDLDLHVVTPAGNEISWLSRENDGGELDVDQCIFSCGAGTHVENVVFLDTPASGTYGIYVVNFDGRAGASFAIEVAGAVTESFEGELPAVGMETSVLFEFTY